MAKHQLIYLSMAGELPGHCMIGENMTTFEIVFDGGSKGNPGLGYGSYRVFTNGQDVTQQQLTLGNNMTNNQAEYLTLIHALEWLGIARSGQHAETEVIVRGDSLLVINQVGGKWKVKNEGLQPLALRARKLLSIFGRHQLIWHDRSNSVRLLGH